MLVLHTSLTTCSFSQCPAKSNGANFEELKFKRDFGADGEWYVRATRAVTFRKQVPVQPVDATPSAINLFSKERRPGNLSGIIGKISQHDPVVGNSEVTLEGIASSRCR